MICIKYETKRLLKTLLLLLKINVDELIFYCTAKDL